METIFNVITSNLANKMPFKSLFKELGDANINSEQKLKYLMFSAYCFYFDGDITHTKEILSDIVNYCCPIKPLYTAISSLNPAEIGMISSYFKFQAPH